MGKKCFFYYWWRVFLKTHPIAIGLSRVMWGWYEFIWSIVSFTSRQDSKYGLESSFLILAGQRVNTHRRLLRRSSQNLPVIIFKHNTRIFASLVIFYIPKVLFIISFQKIFPPSSPALAHRILCSVHSSIQSLRKLLWMHLTALVTS